jgi:hypothetical protein
MGTLKRDIHRRLMVSVVAAAMLATTVIASPVAAVNGDLLRTITADKTGALCSIQTGVGFNGTNLLLSCWYNNTILVTSPVDGSQVAAHSITGASGFGALAWDSSTSLLWACNMGTGGYEVGTISLVTDTYTPVFQSQGCIDGLAYDGSDNTIWASYDAAPTVQHYTTSGTLLSSHSISLGGTATNSGIAVGGTNLYLANDGSSQIYTVAKDFSTETLFATFPARLEDMECDNVSFPGKTVIWSQDAYDSILNAYEIPNGSCNFGGGVSGSISLTPATATNPAGTHHTVTAHVTSGGAPLASQVVTFTVTGQNAGATGTCVPASCATDATGNVTFTYLDANGAGDDTITASFTDATGAPQSATAKKHWAVTDPTITAAGVAVAATEGTAFSGTVATFTDPDTSATASEYTATIDWGDGTTLAGTISGSGGSFTVSGGHTYAEEGTHTVTVTITDTDNAANKATVTSTATVADATLTSACAMPSLTTQAYAGKTATFTDASSTGTLSDFSATINWGDSSTSVGAIAGGPGTTPYAVSGSHAYTSTGYFTVTTKVTDVGGSTTTATCNTVLVFAFAPGGGAFAIGDKENKIGASVNFWGAQWSKNNPVSSGTTVAAFKGFAENPTTPTCGTTWSTDPGNSTPPPVGPLPAYMGVIVTSSYSMSGPVISGNILHIVVVKTDPGYAPNPGHPGTGTVVAQSC